MASLFELISGAFEPTRQEKLQGLLGNYGQMPQIGQQGMDPQAFVQNPQMQPNSPLAQAQMFGGMLDAGYNSTEAGGLMGLLNPQQQQDPTTLMQNLGAAGVDLNTPEGQQTMLDIMRKPQTQINMGQAGAMWTPAQVKDAGLAPGTVVTTDKNGKPTILNKEKYTQAQNTAAGFATRMATAQQDLNAVMAEDPSFDPTSMQYHSNKMLPDFMANQVRSPAGQRYRQAQENWISANLRKESGAVLGADEIEQEMAKWFPAWGDDAKTIQQKERARRDAELSMQRTSGGAYQELEDAADMAELEQLRQEQGR